MPRSGPLQLAYCVCWWVVSIPPPHPTPSHRPAPTSLPSAGPKHTVSALPRRPSGDHRYRPAMHHVTMLWSDSTKLGCRADLRSEWLSRLKCRLSFGSVVTCGFESRSDILRLQTVLVELLVEHLLYYRFYTNRLLNVMLNWVRRVSYTVFLLLNLMSYQYPTTYFHLKARSERITPDMKSSTMLTASLY